MKTKCLYCQRNNDANEDLCKSCGAPLPLPSKNNYSNTMTYFGYRLDQVEEAVGKGLIPPLSKYYDELIRASITTW